MKETEFLLYAQALSIYYMKGRAPEDFVKQLFQGIYLKSVDEDFDDPVEDTLPRTYKAYYYGDNNITKLAKKICNSLDTLAYSELLYLDAGDSISGFCNTMRTTYLDIDRSNYQTILAERFQAIIENAAKTKRKKASSAKVADKVDVGIDYKNKYRVSLVAEEQSVCPNDGCTNSLFIRVNGQIALDYEVVVIDPALPVTGEENLNAMCPDCTKNTESARMTI